MILTVIGHMCVVCTKLHIDLYVYTQQKPPNEPVYTDLHHSTTDRPVPPPPAEQTPVQYATDKKPPPVQTPTVDVSSLLVFDKH